MSIHQTRCQQAQTEMQKQAIDLLFASPSADLVYLVGYHTHISTRLTLFALPAEGDALMVVPELEAPAARGVATFFPLHTWADGSDPYAQVRSLLPRTPHRIAVSDQMWSLHLLRLQATLPSASFVPASQILAPLRRVKDAAEVAALRRAAQAADAVMSEALALPLVGRTESDVARQIGDMLIAHGHQRADFVIVAGGENSGSPHHIAGDRKLREGDALVLDFGGVLDDYFSDITRSVVLGEPSAEYGRVYEAVRQAQQAAFEAVRPGVSCQEIDRAARRVITEAGYGPYFIHRTGHGLGLDVHEEPYMVEGNTMALAPGMVFSIEPGIYLPGRFGVRIEDIVVVTDAGAERLNTVGRELRLL